MAGEQGFESSSMTSCFGESLSEEGGTRCGGSEDAGTMWWWCVEEEGRLVGTGWDLIWLLGCLCEIDKSVASSCCAIGFLERLLRASMGSCL